MKPNAAVALILAGGSLLGFAWRPGSTASRHVAFGAAAAVAAIGLLTGFEYVVGWDLGFDQWLFQDPQETAGSSFPGRMGLNTAVCLLLLGGGLLLAARGGRRGILLSEGLTIGAMLLGFIALLGYLYHDQSLYGIGQYTPMAFQTAVTILLVGFGTLFLHPDHGLMAVVTSDDVGGYLLRRLLPGMVLILPGIGWLCLYGEREGLYGTSLGVAIFATLATVVLFSLLWWAARSVNEADRARRQSDRLFASFMSNLPALAWIKDARGRYVYLNEAFQKAFEVRLDDWRSKTDREVLPTAIAEQFQANDAQVISTKRPILTVETAPHRDGLHESVVSKFPIVDEEGRLTLVGGVAVDITERKRVETALRESEERFRQVTGHIQEVFWLSDTAKNEILYISPGYETIWGRSCESLYASPRSWLEAIHPDDRERVLSAAVTKQATGSYDEEYRVVRSDGSIRWIRDRAFPILNEQGLVVRIAGVADDITTRKEAEAALLQVHQKLERRVEERTAALAESQQQLEVAIKGAGLASWDWDIESGAVRFNDRWAEIRGLLPRDVIPHISSWKNGIHSDDRDRVEEQLQACLVGHAVDYEAELRVKTGTGEWTWVLERGRVIERDAQGKPVRMAGIEIDITARKRSELELRRAQAFVNSVVENLPNMVFVKDAKDLRFVQLNRAGEELLGLSREELKGKNDYDFFPQEEADFFTEKDRQVLQSRSLLEIPSEPIQTRQRGIRILHTKKIPLCDESGEPRYLLGISEDITDQKRAETALRQSEERYSSLVSQATDIIYTAGLDGRFTFVNAAACAVMGYDQNELLGKHYLELIRQDYREAAQRFYRQQLLDRTPSTYFEFPSVTKDGREVWFGQHVQLRVVDGQTVGVEAITRDITDRKQAHQFMEERAKCEAFAADVSLNLNRDEPLSQQLQYCTDAAVKHLGLAFARIWLVGPGDLCEECHKQSSCRDRTECLHLWGSAGLSRNLNGEYRRIPLGALKIGQIAQGSGPLITNEVLDDDRLPNKRWIQENGLQSFAGFPLVVEGRVFGVLAVFGREAITPAMRQTIESVCNGLAASVARKQAGEALRESEARTRAIVESALDAVITMDERGVITGWNSQASLTFGFSEQEVMGKLLSETIIPSRYRAAHTKGLKQFLLTGENHILNRRIELSALHKGGYEFPIELSVTAITVGERQVFSAFLRDISGRKRAETAVKDAYERLREVTRQLAEAEEVERRRIARELHDEFGQALTGLKFDVAWLNKQLSRSTKSAGTAALKAKTAAMSESVDGLIHSVRATAAALRPGVLDDLGLVAAVEWLVASFRQRTGLHCELDIDPGIGERAVGSELATTVFRGAQELLTNVMRHARAKAVSVHLTMKDDQLCLTVRDDGRGIKRHEWDQSQSLGLRGLRERVTLIGGTITLADAAKGTDISLVLPLRMRAEEPTVKEPT